MKVRNGRGRCTSQIEPGGQERGRAFLLLLLMFLAIVFLLLAQLRGGFSSARQPIAFTHRVHAEKQIDCAFCHQYATSHAIAGLPSVHLCITCHSGLGLQTEEIKKIFSYAERGMEIPWVRVYRFPPHAHVIFNHARHVAARVSCTVCHGDVASMTVAVRAVEHTMGWCVDCHKQNARNFARPDLATDCLTCHK